MNNEFHQYEKNILVLFFFSTLCVNAQLDTIVSVKRSVIALDKVKTIYRGFANPITIAVSDCKSFTAEGIGLMEVSKGKYTISPGQGLESKVIITIINLDDSISIEEHVFKIANIPQIMAKINNENCYNCIIELTKDEIKNSVISIGINDFKFDLDFEGEYFRVNEFDIVPKGTTIKVQGNTFSKDALTLINKLKVGAIFSVENVRYANPHNICRGVVYPIKIMNIY
ncbi:GldM family protein [Flavobacterium tegetincola]|uniref:GldM family protein n=1 Tax=Flavobacterium tegetincola TaxID=150172 RepID=UPI0003F651CB|nr:GldM family protein [Flavobacterium tegetincola]